MIGVLLAAEAGTFRRYVQTGSGAHLTSFNGSLRGVKRSVREDDHSLPCTAEVKNVWINTSNISYIFVPWCLIKLRQW
jgi:hypothetical protein